MKVLRALISSLGVMALVGCGAATASPNVSSSTPTPVDVAGAQRAALSLFVENPSYAGNWLPCQWSVDTTCPLSTAVKDRFVYLASTGFGGDVGGCGEDYITGTQNGMFNAPVVLSAVAESNGTVTVVIQRVPSHPNLTAVMTNTNGTWLATDLGSGTGPSASIFSAKPNC
jgi:hypothetical protein